MKKETVTHVVVTLLIVVLTAVLMVFGAFGEPESYAEDSLYQKGEVIPADIKIIAIDEETLQELGPYTDWSRDYFARLMEIFNSAEKKPAVIGFDIIFSGEGDPAADAALADAVAKSGPVVLASKLDISSKIASDASGSYTYDYYVKDEATAYSALSEKAESGFTNALLDKDGYVRRAYLTVRSQGSSYPSFVSQVLRAYGIETGSLPDVIEFKYTGRPNEFEAVPMCRVMDGTVPPDYFADSIVLIGAYDEGMLDSYSVPIDHSRLMYGVEAHANVINAVRNGYLITKAPAWAGIILIAILLILFGFICSRCNIKIISLAVPGALLLYYAAVLILYKTLSVTMPILYFPAGLIAMLLAMLLIRYVELQKKRAREMKQTLFSMADSMAQAIEGRTPYNANHTRNVAKRSVEMLRYINKLHKEGKTRYSFTENDIDQMYLAAMLHDIGKRDVPLEVMDKPTKLGSTEQRLRDRLTIIKLHIKNAMLESRISAEKGNDRIKKIDSFLDKLGLYNCGKPLSDEERAAIDEMASFVYTDENGEEHHYLTEEELDDLHIKAGTLSDREREIMKSHVVHTDKILSHVHFSNEFDRVRQIASDHHELLNGKGYPSGLSADQLDTMTRILTIMDIYDSLIADDRPYKKPKSVKVAFEILDEEAEAGKVDKELLDIAKQLYQEPDTVSNPS